MPKSSSTSKSPLRLLWLLPVALIGVVGIGAVAMMQPPPADLDLSLTRTTEQGLYVGTLEPGASPVPVGTMQSWTVVVTTADGQPLEHAELSIDGGMPQHGHGLPTEPQVTDELGGGRYRIEGMKFNMPGWWTITLEVSGAAGTDSATFNLTL
ncbi:FixH family protein [Devosia sp. CN2-171]|jgi:hypothetical protein|uniref:FixH family protein n=1 Tax=Devosia sp. CN2-171 TaxID=3400909 RepID=UPI003BF8CBC9